MWREDSEGRIGKERREVESRGECIERRGEKRKKRIGIVERRDELRSKTKRGEKRGE